MEFTKTMNIRSFILITVLAILLSGCSPPSVSEEDFTCDSVLNTPFHRLIGTSLTTEQTFQIIESAYEIQSENIRVEHFPDINEWSTVIMWSKAGTSYYLYWNQEQQLQHLMNEFGKAKPTIEEIMQCVNSQPVWFRALYGHRVESIKLDFYFEMWFPAMGVVTQTRGSVSNKDQLPEINADFPVDYIDIVLPGTVDEVYENLGLGSGYLLPSKKNPLNPWLEDLSQVQFSKIR